MKMNFTLFSHIDVFPVIDSLPQPSIQVRTAHILHENHCPHHAKEVLQNYVVIVSTTQYSSQIIINGSPDN